MWELVVAMQGCMVGLGVEDPPEQWVCSRCDEEKPASEFYKNKDGHLKWCKACTKAYSMRRRKEIRDGVHSRKQG